ncbi:MAG TPA: hypothetical protein VF271_02690, partial [Rhodanobacteraceae bacterium]
MAWSLARLPELDASAPDDPAIAERTAAIVDRFCKLQDQLAGAMRHAHTMLGERQRNFQDVVTWAVSEHILPDEPTWLELRSLRNRLTHEYDLANDDLPDLMALIRQDNGILIAAATRFIQLCVQRGLIRHSSTQ